MVNRNFSRLDFLFSKEFQRNSIFVALFSRQIFDPSADGSNLKKSHFCYRSNLFAWLAKN